MTKSTVVSATVTVPASSTARSFAITASAIPSTAPSPPAPQTAAKTKPTPVLVIRYAAAVLTGQPDMLEAVAPSFVRDSARIKKDEDGWILESSEFARCTTGEQVFPIADDIVSRIHRILALYCDFTPTFSVEHIYWINAEGKKLRSIRGSIPVNIVSSKGLAELKGMRGSAPLGSAVLEAITLDPAVEEALTLHGEIALSWAQVYDILEFVGGVDGAVKAGHANRKKTDTVRQTANHYGHLGRQKNNPLPPNPPTLAEANEFTRSVLKRWISSRL